MNTLDLDPEWGAIDLLEEVEASFGIKIEDAVAEQIETVGDLYDVIVISPRSGIAIRVPVHRL